MLIETKNKFSIRYALLKWWVRLGLTIFFKEIEVKGAKQVPKNAAVLFAVNHPNTLLDALLTCCFAPGQPWFLARGDVFRKPVLAKLFAIMRMMPVFRERDGIAQVKNNSDIFQKCSHLLSNKASLVMFPEGSHNREWRIRDLRKGFARIVAGAYAVNSEVYIVPVGLSYSDPLNSFSNVLIQFGEPLKAADYFNNQDHPIQQQQQLTQALRIKLEALTLHIAANDYQSTYEKIKQALKEKKQSDSLYEQFVLQKQFINALENKDAALPNLAALKTDNKFWLVISLLVCSPIWIVGKLLAILPQMGIKSILKNIKDDHFTASVKFGVGLLAYTLIVTVLLCYSLLSEAVLFWGILKFSFLVFCLFFVPIWEEKWHEFRGLIKF